MRPAEVQDALTPRAALPAIGDCWAPRQLEQAILEGAKAGRAV